MPSQVYPTPPPLRPGKYDGAVQVLSALAQYPSPMPSMQEYVEEAVYMATTNPDEGPRVIKWVVETLTKLDSKGDGGRETKIEFVHELSDRAVSEFVDFWNVEKRCDAHDEEADTPHPLLLSTFLGDLFSLGLIPLQLLEKCIEYLIMNVQSGDDLLALFMLISRSTRKQTQENLFGSESLCQCVNGMYPPKLSPLFLGHCFILIREVCDTLRRKGVKPYTPWGEFVDLCSFIQHFGELFQSCDSRLRFPGIPPPVQYKGSNLQTEEIKKGEGRRYSI